MPIRMTCKHKRHCYSVKSFKEHLIYFEDLMSTY